MINKKVIILAVLISSLLFTVTASLAGLGGG